MNVYSHQQTIEKVLNTEGTPVESMGGRSSVGHEIDTGGFSAFLINRRESYPFSRQDYDCLWFWPTKSQGKGYRDRFLCTTLVTESRTHTHGLP